jgi:hypothetical protein
MRSAATRAVVALVILLTLVVSMPALARADRGEDKARDKKTFFDARQTPQAREVLRGRAAKLDSEPSAAVAALKAGLGVESVVTIDPLTATPAWSAGWTVS